MSSGTIKQVIGAVVDVQFPSDSIPAIYNALTTRADGKIVLEVQQQLGEGVVRTVAMTSTEGLRRGDKVVDTQSPIKVPVGGATLGRIFNVTGDPIDQKGPVATDERLPIHRAARIVGTEHAHGNSRDRHKADRLDMSVFERRESRGIWRRGRR